MEVIHLQIEIVVILRFSQIYWIVLYALPSIIQLSLASELHYFGMGRGFMIELWHEEEKSAVMRFIPGTLPRVNSARWHWQNNQYGIWVPCLTAIQLNSTPVIAPDHPFLLRHVIILRS